MWCTRIRSRRSRVKGTSCATRKGLTVGSVRQTLCLRFFALLDGGCSSPSRAPGCGSGVSGFETRQPSNCTSHTYQDLDHKGAGPFAGRHCTVGARKAQCHEVMCSRGNPCPCKVCLSPGSYGLTWPPETRPSSRLGAARLQNEIKK